MPVLTLSRLKKLWVSLGPGLITGASDDDPSGIATYSQVGARFGFGMLWTMLFSYPLMSAVQEASALIGRVTGRGIAGNIRRHYPRWLLYTIVVCMFMANTLNLGADIAAMGAATQLVLGGHTIVYSILLTVVSLSLEIFVPYSRYVFYLKWLTLALLAYVATLWTVRVPWGTAFYHTLLPTVSFKSGALTSLIAVLGTTISPYLFFWQASEEAEEIHDHRDQKPLKQAPEQAAAQIRRIFIDTFVGMGFSNLIAFCIILTAAVTLHGHGLTHIETAEQAAKALEPLAGRYAALLFALGIIGTGLLTLPVLAGSAAYALGETFGWRTSLEAKPRKAKAFYGVIAASMLLGLGMNFFHFSPMKALYWTAVINGIVAGPVLVVVMLMADNRRIMGPQRLSRSIKILGWLTAILMIASTLGSIVTSFR